MGEQNRRAVEVERPPGERATPRRAGRGGASTPDADRALGPDADERQTSRQAPGHAAPGEGAEDDSIG